MELWIVMYLVGAIVGSFATWYALWLMSKKRVKANLGFWFDVVEHRLKRGGDYREFVKKKP